VTAAGHQIRKTDFVHFAEVRMLNQIAARDNPVDIHLEPTQIREREFDNVVIQSRRVTTISHQPSAIRQFDQGTNLVKTGRVDEPADFTETAHIDVVVLLS
jgi:hypothetical protein